MQSLSPFSPLFERTIFLIIYDGRRLIKQHTGHSLQRRYARAVGMERKHAQGRGAHAQDRVAGERPCAIPRIHTRGLHPPIHFVHGNTDTIPLSQATQGDFLIVLNLSWSRYWLQYILQASWARRDGGVVERNCLVCLKLMLNKLPDLQSVPYL